MMIIDATTGLPNYSFFEDAIEETLAELMAEVLGDPEESSPPVREPGEPLGDFPDPDEPEEEDEEDDEEEEEPSDK